MGSRLIFQLVLFHKSMVENKINNHTRKLTRFRKLWTTEKKTPVFQVSLTYINYIYTVIDLIKFIKLRSTKC